MTLNQHGRKGKATSSVVVFSKQGVMLEGPRLKVGGKWRTAEVYHLTREPE